MKERTYSKETFSKLIQEHQGIINKITRIYVEHPEERKDLFQEICLQLWKSWPTFRKKSSFSTWLYRVSLNTAISMIRKKKYRIRTEPLKEYDLIEENLSMPDKSELLYKAIAKLSRIEKAIILLWLEEKSYEEISDIIGISRSNVSVKLVRIRKKLESMIG